MRLSLGAFALISVLVTSTRAIGGSWSLAQVEQFGRSFGLQEEYLAHLLSSPNESGNVIYQTIDGVAKRTNEIPQELIDEAQPATLYASPNAPQGSFVRPQYKSLDGPQLFFISLQDPVAIYTSIRSQGLFVPVDLAQFTYFVFPDGSVQVVTLVVFKRFEDAGGGGQRFGGIQAEGRSYQYLPILLNPEEASFVVPPSGPQPPTTPSPSAPVAPVSVPANNQVHAMVISGKSDPAQVVSGPVTIIGGVAALGTQAKIGPSSAWDPKVRIVRDPDLVSGNKIPPITPNIYDVRIVHHQIQADLGN